MVSPSFPFTTVKGPGRGPSLNKETKIGKKYEYVLGSEIKRKHFLENPYDEQKINV